MNKITAILIDDEEKALEGLQIKVSKYFPEIEIVALCNNPKKAIETINNLKPDLLFIDIEMPVYSGFDVLAKIDNPTFETIFVTAYNNYAIEAIKNCAIGYIVKPIDNEELKLAVSNAIKNIQQKTAFEKNLQLLTLLGNKNSKATIAVPSQKGLSFIKTDSIIRFEGVEGYTRIYTTNQKPFLSSYSIGKFCKLLENSTFFLCHKSHLINLNHIKSIFKEGTIELVDNSTITCARTKKNELLEKMKQL